METPDICNNKFQFRTNESCLDDIDLLLANKLDLSWLETNFDASTLDDIADNQTNQTIELDLIQPSIISQT